MPVAICLIDTQLKYIYTVCCTLVAHISGEFGCVHLGRVLLSQEDSSIPHSTQVAIKTIKSKLGEQVSAFIHAVPII